VPCFRDELAPRHSERVPENELGRVGEPVTHFHQRQRAEPIRDRYPENPQCAGRADRLELSLDIVGRDAAQRALEHVLELPRASAACRTGRASEQLVEQHRLLRHLFREPCALRHEVQQTFERRGVRVERDRIRAAPAPTAR
jgi:hypothetical protein